MKNKSIYIFVVVVIIITFLSLLLNSKTHASQGLNGIVINSETKQCTDYNSGDEFVEHVLPEGWTAYYDDRFVSLITDYGSCYVKEGDDYTECCKQLNLKTVDYKTIPYNQELVYLEDKYSQYIPEAVNNHLPSKCKPPYTGEMLESTGISINKETRECTALLEYNLAYELPKGGRTSIRSTYGECLLDNNWIAYPLRSNKTQEEYVMVTPYGKCDFKIGSGRECCEKLGLTYISDNIGKTKVTGLGRTNLPLVTQWYYLPTIYKILIPLILIIIIVFVVIFIIRKKRHSSLETKVDKTDGGNMI